MEREYRSEIDINKYLINIIIIESLLLTLTGLRTD